MNKEDDDVQEITMDDQMLDLIPGQRGKHLLVVNGFTFSKNNVVGSTTYWCCRTRTQGHEACKARVLTTDKKNGLHKINITKPRHNHAPSTRMLKKFSRQDVKVTVAQQELVNCIMQED